MTMDLLSKRIGDINICRRMLFSASFLPKAYPFYWKAVSRFATLETTVEDTKINEDVCRLLMENIEVLSPSAFVSEDSLTQEIVHMKLSSADNHPIGIVLISSTTCCLTCNSALKTRADRPSHLTLYTSQLGTINATHYHKLCSNRLCKTVQHYGYRTMTGTNNLFYDDSYLSLPYFVASQETAFEITFLSMFDAELLIGQVSYSQKAEIYNYHNSYASVKKRHSTRSKKATQDVASSSTPQRKCNDERIKLDRRRFEEAHLRFAVLKVKDFYPDEFPQKTVLPDIQDTLKEITPKYFQLFRQLYGNHKCGYPGCGTVLVIDGNMKNYRDVCMAKYAGFIEFEGLQGTVATGCMQTPAYKSRYCSSHTPQVCLQSTSSDDPYENIAEVIVGKKSTRNETYYQVQWLGRPTSEVSWEPASQLNESLIEDYENDLMTAPVTTKSQSYGSVVSTITVLKTDKMTKKQKLERPLVDKATGAFTEDDVVAYPKCNTEKDKVVRQNHRTAGVLAMMWPCGVISSLSELYNAESKSQVYGQLHDFLRNLPNVASNLKFICYDDGCHLRKYSRQAKRVSMSDTAKCIADIDIVVDKLHMRGHTDPWCKENCDPHSHGDLDEVDTEVCEQVFSWLSCYGKITKHMNRYIYLFFLLYICDLHNARELKKLELSSYL